MDQISGLMPQIGWSPLLMPATPKKAPASTVEPAAKSANLNSGMEAGVDTQTPQDRAQQVQALKAQAALIVQTAASQSTLAGLGGQNAGATGSGAEETVLATLLAGIEPPPDPDAPTGPPPTFDVTPLEAAAARRLAPPEALSPDPAPEPEAEPPRGAAPAEDGAEAPAAARQGAAAAAPPAAAPAGYAAATGASAPGTAAEEAQPERETRPQPAQEAQQIAPQAGSSQGDWHQMDSAPPPNIDVTR